MVAARKQYKESKHKVKYSAIDKVASIYRYSIILIIPFLLVGMGFYIYLGGGVTDHIDCGSFAQRGELPVSIPDFFAEFGIYLLMVVPSIGFLAIAFYYLSCEDYRMMALTLILLALVAATAITTRLAG